MDRIRFMRLSRTSVLLGLLFSGLLTAAEFYTAAFYAQIPFLLLGGASAWTYFRTPRNQRDELFRSEKTRMYTSALHPYYLFALTLAVHALSFLLMHP